jgi:hypothetical protein
MSESDGGAGLVGALAAIWSAIPQLVDVAA